MLTTRHVLQRVVQTAEEVVQEVAAGQETLRTNPEALTLKLKGTDESQSLFLLGNIRYIAVALKTLEL